MKKTLLLFSLVIAHITASAQKIFGTIGQDVQSEVEAWFPWVVAIAFVIGSGIMIFAYLVGENRNVKAFIYGELTLVVGIAVVAAGYKYIQNISL